MSHLTALTTLPLFDARREQLRARFLKGILIFLMVAYLVDFIFEIVRGTFRFELIPFFFLGMFSQLIPYILLHKNYKTLAVWVFLFNWWGAVVTFSWTLQNHLTLAILAISITILLVSSVVGTPKQLLSFGLLIIATNIFFTLLMALDRLHPIVEGFDFSVLTSLTVTLVYLIWTGLIYLTNRLVDNLLFNFNTSNAELNIMLENVPVGIWYVNLEGTILRANQYITQLLEYDLNELKTKHFTELAHSDDKATIWQSFQKLLDQTSTYSEVEKRFVSKSGQIKNVILRISPVIDEGTQKPAYFVAAIEDITDKLQTAKVLRESEFRYEVIFNNTPLMVHFFNREGQIIEVNAHWLEKLNYQREDVIGKHVFEFLNSNYYKYAGKMLAPKPNRPQGVVNHELQFVTRNGQLIDCLVSVSWVYEDDNKSPLYGIAFLTDVTALRKTEALLHQAQRLDSLGHLAGGVAHDFNNLLTGAMAQTSLLLRKLPKDSWESQRALKTKASLDRAAELTKQLLTYVGKSPSDLQYLDINEIVEESKDLLSMGVPSNIEITYDLHPNPLPIKADLSQVKQVLHNLIQNSQEALITENKGLIEVETYWRYLEGDDLLLYQCKNPLIPGPYVELFVKDNGIGMDERTIMHIFDPFFTTKTTGHGLGMASILGILYQHDGGVKIESMIGKGTAVSILIPLYELPPSISTIYVSTRQEELPEKLRGQILISDDSPFALEALSEILETVGLSVLTTKDGVEATAVYKKTPHTDLVILDLQMPNQNGIQTFHQIKSLNPNQKIILTSGYSELFSQELEGLPIDAFLQKPYESAEVLTAVASILSTDQQIL